jgi:hypothetical protein
MYNVNDEILVGCRPSSLSKDDYKADIETIISNSAYHSDEMSETDDEKANEEINKNIRPKNKEETDKHVIRVYDKAWRSRRVSKYLLFYLL